MYGKIAARAIKVARFMTGRWVSRRDIAIHLGFTSEEYSDDSKKNNKVQKLVSRIILTIEEAEFPLEVDMDESDSRKIEYFRISRSYWTYWRDV